jgi:hypothetical protein
VSCIAIYDVVYHPLDDEEARFAIWCDSADGCSVGGGMLPSRDVMWSNLLFLKKMTTKVMKSLLPFEIEEE